MSICQEDLDKLFEVERAHNDATELAQRAQRQRAETIALITAKGATRAEVANALGITRARVQQILDAAHRFDVEARIEERRADPDFRERLDRIAEQNREILERLGR